MEGKNLYQKMKGNHDLILRIGFGIFLLIWGMDRIIRAEAWASASLMGHFYGNLGLMVSFVAGLGIVQVLIALSLLINFWVRITSLILLAMMITSLIVTILPLMSYLLHGGAPVPAILFADHFPLIAGAWAIHAHT